jgi:hypothetical protein
MARPGEVWMLLDLSRARAGRRAFEDGHMTIREIVKMHKWAHPDRHSHALEVAYATRKMLQLCNQDEAIPTFEHLSLLHEIGGIGIPDAAWREYPRAEYLQLSAIALEQLGHTWHGGMFWLLALDSKHIAQLDDVPLEILHLVTTRQDLIRARGTSAVEHFRASSYGPVVRSVYSTFTDLPRPNRAGRSAATA